MYCVWMWIVNLATVWETKIPVLQTSGMPPERINHMSSEDGSMNERCKFDYLPKKIVNKKVVSCDEEDRYCEFLTEDIRDGVEVQCCVLPTKYQKYCIYYSVQPQKPATCRSTHPMEKVEA